MEIQLDLHSYGCEDAGGGARCCFGPALHGLRHDGEEFTLALGQGEVYGDFAIMVQGHVDDDAFRRAGVYQLFLINKHPDYQKPTFQGVQLTYCFAGVGKSVSYLFPELGRADLPLVDFDNFGE